MTSHQIAVSQRLGWIDSSKGLGIIFVVIGHAWRGLETAGLIRNYTLYKTVDTAIYSFHMPLFFFLSGLLIERILLVSSPVDFVVSRVQRLLWPLALWTWLFFLFKGFGGNLVNKASEWANFPVSPLPPREHFWFLWALFVIQLTMLPVKVIIQRSVHRQWGWTLVWLGSVLLYLFQPPLYILGPWLRQAISHAPFYLLGATVASLRNCRPPVWVGLMAFLTFLGVVASAVYVPTSNVIQLAIGSIAAMLLCCTMMSLQATPFSQSQFIWVEGLGKASLAIYVSHTIFSAVFRIALLKIGIADIWIHMMGGTLAGLLGPVALYLATKRTGVSAKLGF